MVRVVGTRAREAHNDKGKGGEPLQPTLTTSHAPRCPSSNSPSFLAPLFFLLFLAFSLGFSPRVSIMDLTGFLAFSESSNFFMVVGARTLLLSSASLKRKGNSPNPGKGPSNPEDNQNWAANSGVPFNPQHNYPSPTLGKEGSSSHRN